MGKGRISFLLVAFVTLAMAVGNSLYASPLFIYSAQRSATAGRFGSDADEFMSVRGWNTVSFDNWFGVVSFFENRGIITPRATFGGTEMAQIGFATRLGGVYVALYYGGNAWRGFGAVNDDGDNVFYYTVQTMPFFGASQSMRVYNVMPTLSSALRAPIYNEFAVLVGIAGMGFRLSYSTTYQSIRLNDPFAVYQAGGTVAFYRSMLQEWGFIVPEISWGMTRELIPGRGIRPGVRLSFESNRDSIRREPFDGAGQTRGVEILRSQNHLNLGLTVGLGGFTLLQSDEFRWTVDFEYGLNMFTYNNEYSFLDAGNNFQTGRLRGHRTPTTFDERSRHSHAITPSMSASWSDDRIRLASRFGMNVRANFEEVAALGFRTGEIGTLVNHGAYSNMSAFVFAPVLDLGMQWAVVPDRFFLNAGGAIGLGTITLRTVDHRTYNQGAVVPVPMPPRTARYSIFSRAETTMLLGFTFNPTPNIELQAMGGVNSVDNAIRVFDASADGFLRFASILGKVRF